MAPFWHRSALFSLIQTEKRLPGKSPEALIQISAKPRKCHAFSRSRAFVKCPHRRLSHCFHADYSMIVATLLYVHLRDIRPVYCGVQMVIFRVICEEKSRFSAVSVWFLEILLSWCYHNISVFIYISVFILSENGFNC